jgi:CheY-like chemotaxis protein
LTPFFTTKEIGIGSGLGLSICQNIVKGFGGDIKVESALHRGSQFTVRLPVKRDSQEIVQEAPRVAVVNGANIHGRILVVDDEVQVRSALARMLKEHKVTTVASGEEGQSLLRKDSAFDLVVCDVMMPRMSGMDLHEWVKVEVPQLANQFIFVTGGSFTPKARDYLTRVDNIRFEKPFDVALFKQKVAEMIIANRSKDA